jgi:poly(A) polymerase
MTTLVPRSPKRPLIWPEVVRDVQAVLHDSSTPVYIVGGAVRDAYLHRPVHDLDLATPKNAIKLGRRIANRLSGDFFVLDAERDVGRVLAETSFSDDKLVIDIACFRGDGLLADLTDRDFTLNAMAVDLRGDLNKLIDPLNGEQDLLDKVLRQCNPKSVTDDPLRALRAVRQSVQLNARIEPETLKYVRAASSKLMDSSPERVRDEFFKLLNVSRPVAALRVADTLGLLTQILPEIAPLHNFELPAPHVFDGWQHTLMVVEKLHGLLAIFRARRPDDATAVFDYGVAAVGLGHLRPQLEAHISEIWPNERSHHALLLLAALLHDVGLPLWVDNEGDYSSLEVASKELAIKRALGLRLSNDEKNRLAATVRYHTFVQEMPISDLEMHRFWRNLGVAGVDVCLLALADYLGMVGIKIDQKPWVDLVERIRNILDAYYNRYDQVVAPPLLLDGKQLMENLSLKPGKRIGELLTLIREGQVTGDISTIDEGLAAARAYLVDR